MLRDFELFILFELLFIAGTLLYYKFRKKNLKEEIINIISPKKLPFKAILIEILLGLAVGIAFYFVGNVLRALIMYLVFTSGVGIYSSGVRG